MIWRGVAAVLIGVFGAALINAVLIVIISGELAGSPAGLISGVAFIAAVGTILTAPAWLLFCLIFLPVMTHRAKMGRGPARVTYLSLAFLLGAAVIVPLFAFLELTHEAMWQVPLLGGVGGLSIALMWSFLVLDIISPRDFAHAGATHG